jgi:TRAP-type mannitol/chloroaromatic compound transport system substrate-binding protein
MNRRKVLIGMTGVATGAAATFPAPSIAQGVRELKMVTDWPKALPGLGTGAERLAKKITEMTDGRLKITVYPAGSLVRPLETLDAVSAGVADMYHSVEYYFEKKTQAFNFFGAVPYGLTGTEFSAWIYYGGGQALWDEVSGQFGVKPLLCGTSGVQMGGWFNKEISSPEGFKGLRYRMPGLGGEVLRRMGASVVNLPGGEIVGALKSGAIDASEWVGPWLDISLGLDKAVDYYYYPGFHEPGTAFVLGFNKTVWDGLTPLDRRIIEGACASDFTHMLAEFTAENAKALKAIRKDGRIKVLRFDDRLTKVFGKVSREVLADVAAKDPLTRKIYESYMTFLTDVMDLQEITDLAYLTSRRLALSAG